jgi:hypothetical protein
VGGFGFSSCLDLFLDSGIPVKGSRIDTWSPTVRSIAYELIFMQHYALLCCYRQLKIIPAVDGKILVALKTARCLFGGM